MKKPRQDEMDGLMRELEQEYGPPAGQVRQHLDRADVLEEQEEYGPLSWIRAPGTIRSPPGAG